MTTQTSVTRVRGYARDELTAECLACGAELALAAGAEVAAALASLDRDHPARPHRRPTRAPSGWRVPLSAFGAWSQ